MEGRYDHPALILALLLACGCTPWAEDSVPHAAARMVAGPRSAAQIPPEAASSDGWIASATGVVSVATLVCVIVLMFKRTEE